MPGALSEGALVLVTGASGFLSSHVVHQLLERGYRVRGTVRSEEKGKALDDIFNKLGLAKRWEWTVVQDVEPEGAFDQAVIGVDGIAHVASPFHYNVKDPYRDLINPAVNGTVNVLKSALKEPKLRRVVLTSSFAAMVNPHEPVYVFDEKDWNQYSLDQLKDNYDNITPSQAYRASKTLAEKAAWNFVAHHTPKDGTPPFDLATINPSLIYGPLLHPVPSAASLNTSVGIFYSFLQGNKTEEDALVPYGECVDVRDVAQLHLQALITQEAGGKRFPTSTCDFYYQKALDVVFSRPDLVTKFPNAVKGKTGAPAPVQNRIDCTTAKQMFGWTPIPFEKMIIDMAESLSEREKEWK
ncbi:putative D-lactaldehyde dehydrogenase [Meredithblackwellia eburnea MCA 4105]